MDVTLAAGARVLAGPWALASVFHLKRVLKGSLLSLKSATVASVQRDAAMKRHSFGVPAAIVPGQRVAPSACCWSCPAVMQAGCTSGFCLASGSTPGVKVLSKGLGQVQCSVLGIRSCGVP